MIKLFTAHKGLALIAIWGINNLIYTSDWNKVSFLFKNLLSVIYIIQ